MKGKGMRLKAFAVAMAAMLAVGGLATLMDDGYVEEAEAEPVTLVYLTMAGPSWNYGLPIFGAGMAAGALLMYIIMSNVESDPDPSIMRNYRNYEALLIETNYGNVATIMQTVGIQDSKLWRFTESHWSRAQELAVADLYAHMDSYDGDVAFNSSMGRSTVSNHAYTMQSLCDFVFYQLSERGHTEYSKDGFTKDKFNYGIKWDDGRFEGNRDASSILYPDTCVIATPTPGGNLAYLDTEVLEGDRVATSGFVNVRGGGWLTNVETGAMYYPVEGKIAVDGMPSGIYELAPGAVYGGNFTHSLSANAAELRGGMVINHDNGETAWVVPSGNGLRITAGGSTGESSTLGYFVEYDGPAHEGTNARERYAEMGGMVAAWDAVVQSMGHVCSVVNANGQATWDIYETIGESNPFVSPSSLHLVNENVGYTADQRRMMYVSALEQVAAYYAAGVEGFDRPISISKDSLDLICHGDILLKGEVIAKDVVFSPMTYLEGTALEVGRQTWGSAGAAMIWGSAEKLSDWGGAMENGTLVSLDSSGDYGMDIKAIVKAGTSVDSIELNLVQLEKIFVEDVDWDSVPPPPPQPDKIAQTLSIIVTMLGVALFVIGIMSRSPGLIAIGLILTLTGIFVVKPLYLELKGLFGRGSF